MNFYEKVQELQALKENKGTIVLVRCGIFFSAIGKMLTENFEFYIIQIPRGIREKAIRDEISAINYATKQGLQQGEERGARQEKIDIAKNMLNEGIEMSIIEKVTGLTKREIEELK